MRFISAGNWNLYCGRMIYDKETKTADIFILADSSKDSSHAFVLKWILESYYCGENSRYFSLYPGMRLTILAKNQHSLIRSLTFLRYLLSLFNQTWRSEILPRSDSCVEVRSNSISTIVTHNVRRNLFCDLWRKYHVLGYPHENDE